MSDRNPRRKAGRSRCLALALLAIASLAPVPGRADEVAAFEASLSRVDEALRKNPNRVFESALDYCLDRRNFAAYLYSHGEIERARRSLKSCFNVLGIPERPQARAAAPPVDPSAEARARAAREVERALALEPDTRHGLEVYRSCAACHTPEGWGLPSGIVPQIAGQHRRVVIKQLADIRAGYRDNPVMLPYAAPEAIGGAQAIADVAGYIATLEISIANGKGPGDDLARGARIYRESCARCHGMSGEGSDADAIPRIQAQHYGYLRAQLERIRDGSRRNANAEMAALVAGLDPRDTSAVLDYVSRMQPPRELQAPPGWHNPDFSGPIGAATGPPPRRAPQP